MWLNRFSKYFLLLFMVGALFYHNGCSQRDDDLKPLRIGMNTWPGYEPFFLARERKIIAENVYISRVDSATDVIKAFRSDIIDIACVTLDEALILQEKSDEAIKIIAIMDFSTGGDAVLAKREIGSMQLLKGKLVGVESSALGLFMLTRAVDLTPGLHINDLKVVNLGYEHHEKEFIEGRIDAVVTFEPVKTRLLQGNAHVLFDSREIAGEIVDVMVVKQKTIEQKPAALQALVDAWFQSVEYIRQEPDKSMRMMAAYEDVTLEEFKTGYRGLSVPSYEENRQFFATQVDDTIAKMQKLLLEKNLIRQTSTPNLLYSDQFLQR